MRFKPTIRNSKYKAITRNSGIEINVQKKNNDPLCDDSPIHTPGYVGTGGCSPTLLEQSVNDSDNTYVVVHGMYSHTNRNTFDGEQSKKVKTPAKVDLEFNTNPE